MTSFCECIGHDRHVWQMASEYAREFLETLNEKSHLAHSGTVLWSSSERGRRGPVRDHLRNIRSTGGSKKIVFLEQNRSNCRRCVSNLCFDEQRDLEKYTLSEFRKID